MKKVTYRDLCDILKELDQDLVKGALGGAQFKELFYANCKCDKIRAAVEEIVGRLFHTEKSVSGMTGNGLK